MDNLQTFLWFDGQAEDAATFYTSVFRDSKMGGISRYGEGAPAAAGTVMTASFEINGHSFVGLNGGPVYKATPAISFMVLVDDQEELDEYWNRLLDGGETMACGWITDKFGITWQITPKALMEMIQDPNPEKAKATMGAMMQMIKLDIATLKAAYDSVA